MCTNQECVLTQVFTKQVAQQSEFCLCTSSLFAKTLISAIISVEEFICLCKDDLNNPPNFSIYHIIPMQFVTDKWGFKYIYETLQCFSIRLPLTLSPQGGGGGGWGAVDT